MNDGDLAGAVDANYWQSFKLLARACGGEVLEREGMLAVSTGLPVAMLNIAFVKRPLADPQASLNEVMSFYDEKRLPFVLRLREGRAGAWHALQRYGAGHGATSCPASAGAS